MTKWLVNQQKNQLPMFFLLIQVIIFSWLLVFGQNKQFYMLSWDIHLFV